MSDAANQNQWQAEDFPADVPDDVKKRAADLDTRAPPPVDFDKHRLEAGHMAQVLAHLKSWVRHENDLKEAGIGLKHRQVLNP
jgi:hypothetical protein